MRPIPTGPAPTPVEVDVAHPTSPAVEAPSDEAPTRDAAAPPPALPAARAASFPHRTASHRTRHPRVAPPAPSTAPTARQLIPRDSRT
ncbi:hypothetical protein, partial [Halorubrum ezzemoulense]